MSICIGVAWATEVETTRWNTERDTLRTVAIRRLKGIIKYVKNTTNIVESIYRKNRKE